MGRCLYAQVAAYARGLVGYARGLVGYGYAAVPRAGLWPATPPLCRYAVHTKRQGRDHGGSASVQDPLWWKRGDCTGGTTLTKPDG